MWFKKDPKYIPPVQSEVDKVRAETEKYRQVSRRAHSNLDKEHSRLNNLITENGFTLYLAITKTKRRTS